MSNQDRDLTDQELAKMWLDYSFAHEALVKEVERRWPRLGGWKAAAEYLSHQHWNRWHDELVAQGTFSLNVLGPHDHDSGATELMARYRESIQRIADGEE